MAGKSFPARIKELRDEVRANSELNRMRIISVHKEQKEIQKEMAKQQKQTLQKLEKLQKEALTQYPEVEEQCQQDTSEPGPDPELLRRLEAAFPDLPREVLELCVSVHDLFTKEHGTDEYEADAALDNLVERYSKQDNEHDVPEPHYETQTEPDPEEQGFTFADG
jgi:hypothetical protein